MKRIFAFVICVVLLLSCSSCKKLEEIQYSYFNGNFNPFSTGTHTDLAATALTQAYLVVKTPSRSDETAANIEYNAYSKGVGIADIIPDKHADENYVIYTIKIGKDIKFSNGKSVSAKDAAFSLYVYCDKDYMGWAKTSKAPIDGLDEYRYNHSRVSELSFTDEQIAAELENPSDLTKKYIREKIMIPVLEEEYNWVSHIYTDDVYKGTEIQLIINQNSALKEPHNLLAYFYAKKDSGYIPVADKDQLILDIANQYGTDYKSLSEIYGTELDELAQECARRALTEAALEQMEGESVSNIRGITVVDDKTLTVRINSLSETDLENALGVFVAPMSVYGKKCEYKDGTFKIDIKSVLESKKKPVGAGPCVFEGYEKGKGVTLGENTHYFKEVEFNRNVILKETGNSSVKTDAPYFVSFENRLVVE